MVPRHPSLETASSVPGARVTGPGAGIINKIQHNFGDLHGETTTSESFVRLPLQPVSSDFDGGDT
jgi:hypothetical protein